MTAVERSRASSVPRMVLHPEQEAGVGRALAAIPGLELVHTNDDQGVYESLSAGADCLLTHVWEDRFLQPGLRWIQCQGAGTDQFPLDRLREAGIVLTNASGAHQAAAEHAFGLLLALTRGIKSSIVDQQKRVWEPVSHFEIADMTMTILGLGAIGEQIAERAQGWELRVIGIRREASKYRGVVTDVRTPDRLLEALEESDVLVLSMPATADSIGLIGSSELAKLGDGWLINVARGSLVDETALLNWLKGSPRRGAGLDVFVTEPLPYDSELWELPNVVITPHCAGSTVRYGERLAPIVRANLNAYMGAGPWQTRIV